MLDRNVIDPIDDLIERDGFDLSDFDPKALAEWTYDGKLYGLTNDRGAFHCYFNAYHTPIMLDRNVIDPIDDLIERDGFDLSDFDPKALAEWTYDGKLYGLTNDRGAFHCYFNVDLFEEAGITPPASTDIWTWDDLREWAKALTKTDGDQIVQYGYGSGSDWAYDLLPGLAGQMAFNDDVTASLLDNEDTIAILDLYQKMMHEDGSTVAPGSLQTGANELFLAGQLGILLDGTWQAGYFRFKSDEINFTWDVGLPPRMAGSENYFIPNFTGGWVIPKTAPDRDATWEVMKAYASAEFATDVMFVSLSSPPVRNSALEQAGFDQWPDNQPQGMTREFMSALLENGFSRQEIGHLFSSEVNAALNKIALVYSNEGSAADVLSEVAAELTAALGG
jgi:multiple sugar transport system substrate-binding protein